MMIRNIKISFILPCYNVAPYIGRCIESIEHQDIPQEEYEVICVDDCSPDNTGDVIREYQQRYSNIVYHRHETNKTAGGARNTGIDLAQGEYIWFVDPDDSIEYNVLQSLYTKSNDLDLDIQIFNFKFYDESKNASISKQFRESADVVSGQEFSIKYCNRGIIDMSPHCRCLYKREFCITNSLYYPQIRAAQDVVFILKCVLYAKRVASSAIVAYDYYRRLESMTGNRGKLRAEPILSQSIFYPYQVYEMLHTIHPIEERVVKDLEFNIRWSINNESRVLLDAPINEWHNFYNKLKQIDTQVQLLRQYMDRKSKIFFNCSIPYLLWIGLMIGYKSKRLFKKR